MPPSVTILEPTDGSRTSSTHVRLRATIASRENVPIEEVFVRLDGRPLEDDGSQSSIGGPVQNTQTLDQLVAVPPGEHELSVFARTAASTSEPVSVRIVRDAPPSDVLKPVIYVLAVGVSDYRDPRLDLAYADKDALGDVGALESASAGLYARIETKVLTNDQAARAAVTEGFSWLADSVTQHDLALLWH